MIDGFERAGRLRANATAWLGGESPWLVVAVAPIRRASLEFSAERKKELRHWTRRQVEVWPATVAIGSEQMDARAHKLTFTPIRPPGRAARGYYCELNSDGSTLCALQVGTLRHSPADGTRVWALGEGAVAWLALAMSRLAAHAEVLGEAAIDMTVTSPGPAVHAAPIEVWNHADRAYGPAGGRRLADIAPSRCAVDLTTCLSADLARTVRPLVMGMLRQFDLSESRHIDPAGIIQRRHFTGHDESILAWTQAIGVPSAA